MMAVELVGRVTWKENHRKANHKDNSIKGHMCSQTAATQPNCRPSELCLWSLRYHVTDTWNPFQDPVTPTRLEWSYRRIYLIKDWC